MWHGELWAGEPPATLAASAAPSVPLTTTRVMKASLGARNPPFEPVRLGHYR
jgi:hypothetical protein